MTTDRVTRCGQIVAGTLFVMMGFVVVVIALSELAAILIPLLMLALGVFAIAVGYYFIKPDKPALTDERPAPPR